MKHTKGPWRLSGKVIRGIEIENKDCIIAMTIMCANIEEERANAHLIAAAPELLDFGKMSLAHLKLVSKMAKLNESSDTFKVIEWLENTINKAEGR